MSAQIIGGKKKGIEIVPWRWNRITLDAHGKHPTTYLDSITHLLYNSKGNLPYYMGFVLIRLHFFFSLFVFVVNM